MSQASSRGAASSSGDHDSPADTDRFASERTSKVIAGVVLLLTLVVHFTLVSRNLDTGYLAGHEFRQTQTGLSILFIERDNDYSLAYPTPVFGPPWSIPMEFPLYQWIAAKLVESGDVSVPQAGRLVSLACFYLCLPAVYLLMRRFGFGAAAGMWAAALTLSTPVYIFYSRAVMIESLALLFCLWFLLSFNTVRHRAKWSMVGVTAVVGSLAAITKITTFLVFGVTALGLGLISLWHTFRQQGISSARTQLIRFAVAGTPPLVAGVWWVSFTNEVKLSSPGGFFLNSSNLDVFNLTKFPQRFRPETWEEIFHNFSIGVLPLVGLAVLVGLIVWGIRSVNTRKSGWMLGAMLATVFCFPVLYRIHDYYFYAVAVMVAAALAGLTDRLNGKPRWQWVTPVLLVGVILSQFHSFRQNYWPSMEVKSNGGSIMLDFIRDVTDPEEVLIVVGSDWSSNVPYFTQRRSVMIKRYVHDNPTVLESVLNSLEDLTVAGLIVHADTDGMDETINSIVERLELDPNPTFTHESGGFHASLQSRGSMLFHFHNFDQYSNLFAVESPKSIPNTEPTIADSTKQSVTSNQRFSVFPFVTPAPSHYRAEYGMALLPVGSDVVLGAHADADFWVPWNAPNAEFNIQFGLRPYEQANEHDHSDGVWFRIWGVAPDESEVLVWEKWLDPWNNPVERTIQSQQLSADSANYASFRFEVRSGPSKAYDSAYWGKVEIR